MIGLGSGYDTLPLWMLDMARLGTSFGDCVGLCSRVEMEGGSNDANHGTRRMASGAPRRYGAV
jgi:hypothetical protein